MNLCAPGIGEIWLAFFAGAALMGVSCLIIVVVTKR